jgi:probable F420-dependent oxidoreductase
MKFGINIKNFGPEVSPQSLRRWARLAEDTGYHVIMISDHVAVTPDVQSDFPAPFYDPFTSLSWLAAATHEIELGTTVAILPYRHPLLTARMAANLDLVSDGRFILGVGVGWAKQEFEALGVTYSNRGQLSTEYLAAIRGFFENDVFSYEGRHVSFKDVYTAPRPIRPGGLPIWVGGSSEAALKRAAQYGDAWHPFRFSIEWLREHALPRLHQYAAANKKSIPAFCPRLSISLSKRTVLSSERVVGYGSLAQIQEDLKALAKLGAEYVLLDSHVGTKKQSATSDDEWKMFELFAEEILDLTGQTFK